MEEAYADLVGYDPARATSGFEPGLIGTPVGYTYARSLFSGAFGTIEFLPDDGEITNEEITLYSEALWNMNIDVALNQRLFKVNNEDDDVYRNFADAMREPSGDAKYIKYSWRYIIDDMIYLLQITADDSYCIRVSLMEDKAV